ncbi:MULTISPECIES: flagellar basal body P-ring protein FlgI [Cellvibrio]|jgi:flagellar P-ring protein precursor FlgI|uniref:Flagellar P-ring protein n=1 Tax=Cellvibrio fibrivorans TaxID=126350 RepID=A0ABU1UW59_9GAMM|nr:flagellar basal body P-ring protein FlgI [Cellvibrio fibrivorans]MDR7089408.1 flagellar P-ring protein precursor FlgI [Cellvibrio fibrivorans]
MRKFLFLLFGVALALSSVAQAERIKDIASVAGVRANQLVGYGLVVGLDGTGDQTTQSPFTTQSFNSMLKQFGITVPEGARMQMKNVAAVMIQAELPAFAKPGQTIDVTVSSISNAKSLRGGSLLMTPLKGLDGKVYAVAQGNLVVGGLSASGNDGSKITVNIPSAGRIPSGAIVERMVETNFAGGQPIVFNLHRADFTTANALAKSINAMLGPDVARPLDAVSIMVSSPVNPAQRVDFISMLENIDVTPGEEVAKVIINSRTGTIVVGKNVRVSPVAVTHGSLTVSVAESLTVSQPNALAGGQTVVVPSSNVQAEEENNPMFKFAPGANLDDIVKSVNNVGASPSDLMAILEALKQSGALKAELVVI